MHCIKQTGTGVKNVNSNCSVLRIKQARDFSRSFFFYSQLIGLNCKRERMKEENVRTFASLFIALTHFLLEHINNYILILPEVLKKTIFRDNLQVKR